LSELFHPAQGIALQNELSPLRLLSQLLRLLLSRAHHANLGELLQYLFAILTSSSKEIRMQRKASAVWKGSLKDGKGSVSAPSGVLSNTPYSFATRFENTPGTNPEELIAAAHAACFSMALSAQLSGKNLPPDSINTGATLTLEKLDSGWTITAVHLDVVARVPNTDAATFQELANAAKTGCPVSKVLNAKITMDAKLEA
jgi:osmotically inducible protein OsmC